MKRKDIIESLLMEGFTEKTLARMSDKELSIISEKLTVSSEKLDDPKVKAMAQDPNTTIEVTEEKDCEPCPHCDMCKDECTCDHSNEEIEEWVLEISESKFSNFTSKSEIMEIIKSSVSEIDENELPDLLTFDSILSSGTEVKPAPPKTTPGTKPGKPKIGPGIKPDPKPKALAEKK